MKDIQVLISGLKFVHDNAYKCFVDEKPSPKINAEIMIYTQFVMLHLIHTEYPNDLERISIAIHGNLEDFITRHGIESTFPTDSAEFINSRYQHYQTDWENVEDGKIMMRFNTIRNIYFEPLIKQPVLISNVDFSSYMIKNIEFSSGDKALQNILNETITEFENNQH